MRTSTRKQIRRLLSLEKGTIRKSYGDVRVALVYPNTYRLGMSNLGFQTVYALINRNPLACCERSFLLEDEDAVTLESGSTLSSFDVVAFSVSFELDYPNIPEILRRAKIPPRSQDRDGRHPLILAGGAAVMLNPDPIADFADLFVIGEAETVLDQLLSAIADSRGKNRPLLKEGLAQIHGVYVPCFYRTDVDEEGRLREVAVTGGAPYPVRRNPPADITKFATVSELLTPETVFGDRWLVEVSRGCPRTCKFCGARWIYCPPRWRPSGQVLQTIRDKLGADKRVGLLGAAVGDHPGIEQICSVLAEEGADVSVSSVRPGRVTPEFAAALSKAGVRTLTIAPEGGSERIRKKVGKELSNHQLVECARIVKDSSIQSLKVYFMVGLPHETGEDVEQIVQRVAELSSVLRVKVSVSPFVPKAHTEYQRIGMRSLDDLKGTLTFLQKELRKLKRATFSYASPKQAHLQGALSRGLRQMGPWVEAGRVPPGEAERLACRTIPDDEILPWDMFEHAGKLPFRQRSSKPQDNAPNGEPGGAGFPLTFPDRSDR